MIPSLRETPARVVRFPSLSLRPSVGFTPRPGRPRAAYQHWLVLILTTHSSSAQPQPAHPSQGCWNRRIAAPTVSQAVLQPVVKARLLGTFLPSPEAQISSSNLNVMCAADEPTSF